MVGTDFIDKTKRTFSKHLDRERARLATADLFTQPIGDICQTFVAETQDDAAVEIGEALVAEAVNGQLILTRDLRAIAVVANPPLAVLEAVTGSCGVATALVQEVHFFAGTLEITLC